MKERIEKERQEEKKEWILPFDLHHSIRSNRSVFDRRIDE